MNGIQPAAPANHPLTLPATSARAVSLQFTLLMAAAYILPAAAHAFHWPVRWLLPMHWPVILAGLVYGWRGGGVVGLLAPIVSFGLSGSPRPGILPAMTVELFAYGAMAGYSQEALRLNRVMSTGLALLTGRAVFVAVALVTGAAIPTLGSYLQVAVLPGLMAAAAQAVTLPLVASLWVRRGAQR